jgi:hypothetical protein
LPFGLYFGKFSLKIWRLFGLLHHLKIWAYLKLQNLAFFFFWDLATLESRATRLHERHVHGNMER